MKKTEVKEIREKEWQIEGELVLKKEKVYMLKDKELRVKIIQLYYNVLVAEYRGKWKTMKLVIRNYWWPEVTKDVEECNIYQRMKNRIEVPAEKLSKILEKP